jgi:phospho-2-dehydro-3-deoxyheptonate aldolase
LEHDSIEEAHRILTLIANTGMPLASEVMTPAHLARYGNRLSLAWIGARNIGDTILRHAMSAYPNLPIGLKNDGAGNPQPALEARLTIGTPQYNAEIMMSDGHMGIVPQAPGNPNTMIIWRGGDAYKTPKAYEEGIIAISALGLPWAADMAHGVSVAHGGIKSAAGQQACLDHTLKLMRQGRLITPPKMLMIEAYLHEGADTSGNTPGVSRTDACVGFGQLTDMLEQINETHDTLIRRG